MQFICRFPVLNVTAEKHAIPENKTALFPEGRLTITKFYYSSSEFLAENV